MSVATLVAPGGLAVSLAAVSALVVGAGVVVGARLMRQSIPLFLSWRRVASSSLSGEVDLDRREVDVVIPMPFLSLAVRPRV